MIAARETLKPIYHSLPLPLKNRLSRARHSYAVKWVKWKFLGYPNPKWFINERQLRPHLRKALHFLEKKVGKENIGDYFEFGVSRGSSLLLIYEELCRAGFSHVRLFGFDSFEGLPPDVEGVWNAGDFATEYGVVVKRLDENKVDWSRISLIKGFYSDSLTKTLAESQKMKKASVIMIDCDMYSSTKEALDFCEPLIQDDAVIIFDDWNPLAKQNKGEKRAFDEFLARNAQFTAKERGNYHYNPGDFHGKVFHVSRAAA